MDIRDILGAIARGEVDDDLDDIRRVVRDRAARVGEERFRKLKVGDEVTFNQDVGKGLAGRSGRIVGKRRTRVEIDVDGKVYVGSPALLVF